MGTRLSPVAQAFRPAFILAAVLTALSSAASSRVEVLRSTGGLPAHIAGLFRDPVSFQQAQPGRYYVFDRRAHAVYAIDSDMSAAKKIVEIGHEEGRILEPSAFDLEPGGTFVVADAPNRVERVQIFAPNGTRIGGFSLPGKADPRLTIGNIVLNGIGSVEYTGRGIYINHPETGALITEYGLAGSAVRTIGSLRKTGREEDREVHLALNTGLPLANPQGGFYFVFQAGEPLFRKYDQSGKLVFERHVEGREIDDLISALPTSWPRRRIGEGVELPLVLPTIRAAAVDPDGNLWISFVLPYTYVYDPDGEKVRVVQFRAAGVVTPDSMSFPGGARLLITPGCYEFSLR